MTSKSRLAERRKQAGLTQAALAQQLGITQGQVSKYEETGDVPIRLVKPWAQLLGVTPEIFIAEAGGGDGGDDEKQLPEVTTGKSLAAAGGGDGGDSEKEKFNFDDSLYADLTENLHLLQQYIDRFPHLEKSRAAAIHRAILRASEREDGLFTVAQFRDRVTTLAEKPRVVVTGHFDAGKSHLCNFYLGGRFLPASYRPTTKYPTFVHHVSDRPQWFKEDLWLMGPKFEPEKWYDEQHCTENRRLAGSWDTLKEHATLHSADDSGKEGTVLAFVNAPLLHSCVLVDLPGYDDTQTKATLIDQAGSQASVLIYICRAQGFLDSRDFTRIGHLLRKIPHYEASDEHFPVLGNFFIVASHAHPGITTDQLNDGILERGAQDFYRHFEGNLFEDLRRQTGRPITFEDVKARFFSFWQETPVRRQKLEDALKPLLEAQIPTIQARDAGGEIRRFKEEGPALYTKQIGKYEKLLRKKNDAKSRLEKLEETEPARRKEHDTLVERVKHKITSFKDRDLEHLRAVFENEIGVEKLEAMIEQRYSDKKDAQKFAAEYVLEEIQSKTARFRSGLVDDTRDLIEKFAQDYDAQMGKFSDAAPGESGFSFDAKAAFLGGLAGLGTLGALGVWAATLGNLGGYIIVAKAAAALGLSSASAAGAAGVTSVVATLGGPVTLALTIAVGVGALVWRIFADNWRSRLAKKIRELFVEERVLSTLEGAVRKFWDETLEAFQKGADSLDEQYKNHIKELKAAGGSQGNLRILELRLQRCEELKSFFAAIPWRLRE